MLNRSVPPLDTGSPKGSGEDLIMEVASKIVGLSGFGQVLHANDFLQELYQIHFSGLEQGKNIDRERICEGVEKLRTTPDEIEGESFRFLASRSYNKGVDDVLDFIRNIK